MKGRNGWIQLGIDAESAMGSWKKQHEDLFKGGWILDSKRVRPLFKTFSEKLLTIAERLSIIEKVDWEQRQRNTATIMTAPWSSG
ncbi:hypothetical protein [Sporosarcina koreensis]|uniref:hypothetical protein n=1 Tax=Sporosarcina koreensis TaxID=334735 RepID=UPI0015CF09EC|nr:hypothetical protein [Sporosarcina koreensis]